MKSRKEGRSSSAEETLAALLDRQFLDYAVHLSRRHRFLYVVNPKVGCSSILWTLRRFESGDTEAVPQKVGTIHDRKHSPLLRPSDLQAGPELSRAASSSSSPSSAIPSIACCPATRTRSGGRPPSAGCCSAS